MLNLFAQFLNEVATKSGGIAVEASKHTGVFVSFFDIGNTAVNILDKLFK